MAPRNRQGLYDPRSERDACGFGMVAQLDDQPSRLLVDTAIAALSRMTHRGGVAADGLTGDGCGLLIRKPDAFLRALAGEAGIALGARFASGLVFLPHDDAQAAQCRATLEAELFRAGVAVKGWRVPPTNDSVCGQLAKDTLPRIEQLYVEADDGQKDEAFSLALFLARRRAEQQLRTLQHRHDLGRNHHWRHACSQVDATDHAAWLVAAHERLQPLHLCIGPVHGAAQLRAINALHRHIHLRSHQGTRAAFRHHPCAR